MPIWGFFQTGIVSEIKEQIKLLKRIQKVLIMSGYIPDNITAFPETWSFLQKPFRRDPLLEMIENVMNCAEFN